VPKSSNTAAVRAWLVKTEPDVYSIDDLKRDRTTGWDGVRNYQARNFMRDEMKKGDPVLIYHSNAEPPGIVGLATVSREGHPDPTALDPTDPHFDPKSDPGQPRWIQVELRFKRRFRRPLPLAELRGDPELVGMPLLQRGQRLSVQPVSAAHLDRVLTLAGTPSSR
jgi:predicted RNA-binding protein with PUA-like domain